MFDLSNDFLPIDTDKTRGVSSSEYTTFNWMQNSERKNR